MYKNLHSVRNSSKEFINIFNKFIYKRNSWEVWQDFVLFSACAISNSVDKAHFETREELYLQHAKKYTAEEMDYFGQMLAQVVLAFEENPEQDFLGELFMSLELGSNWKGQYFTPYHVCELMSEVNFEGIEQSIKLNSYASVNDPACGAGATLIAFANCARKKEINYQQKILFVGQYIDFTAVLMCYIQLSLLGCVGYVILGNSLSNKTYKEYAQEGNIWYTPFYFVGAWELKRHLANIKVQSENILAKKGEPQSKQERMAGGSYYYYYYDKNERR